MKKALVLALSIILFFHSSVMAETIAERDYRVAVSEIKKGHYRSAHRRLLRLARRGHAKSQTLVGLQFEHGKGARKDHAHAIEWYEKAAVQGLKEAENRLGHLYLTAEKDLRNEEKAFLWLEKAAEQDCAEAKEALNSVPGLIEKYKQYRADSIKEHDNDITTVRKAWQGYNDLEKQLSSDN